MDDNLPGYSEHRISVRDSLTVYVRKYGADRHKRRDTVLCLGGLTRNSKDFHDLAQQLGDRYDIICPDYRGRGRSDYDPDWANYTPPVYLDDIRNIAAALNIHEFAVIGTSLGGLLAMGLGVAMPSSLKGVLLNDVCPELPIHMLESIMAYASATPVLQDWPAAIHYLHDNAPMMPSTTNAVAEQLARNTFRERDDGMIVFDWDPNITRPISGSKNNTMDLWALFSSLRSRPLLSVRGGLSPFVTDQTWQHMQETARDMVCVTVPETGHAPTLAEDICSDAIAEWLKNCFSP